MLSTFADSGLERAAALEKDIAWFKEEGLETPPLGSFGKAYAERLREIAAAAEWEVTYPYGVRVRVRDRDRRVEVTYPYP